MKVFDNSGLGVRRKSDLVKANIDDQIGETEAKLTEDQLEKAKATGEYLILSEDGLNEVVVDLRKGFNAMLMDDVSLEKAHKDLSKLIKTTVIDKHGHKRTVYIARKEYKSHTEHHAEIHATIARQHALLANPKSPASAKQRAQKILEVEHAKLEKMGGGKIVETSGPKTPAERKSFDDHMARAQVRKQAISASESTKKEEPASTFKPDWKMGSVDKKERYHQVATHGDTTFRWDHIKDKLYMGGDHTKKYKASHTYHQPVKTLEEANDIIGRTLDGGAEDHEWEEVGKKGESIEAMGGKKEEPKSRIKASSEFVDQLVVGIKALNEKFGEDKVASLKPFQLFFLVSDALTPGHEHNAKISLPKNEEWIKEKKDLKDDHIETAVKEAIKKLKRDNAPDKKVDTALDVLAGKKDEGEGLKESHEKALIRLGGGLERIGEGSSARIQDTIAHQAKKNIYGRMEGSDQGVVMPKIKTILKHLHDNKVEDAKKIMSELSPKQRDGLRSAMNGFMEGDYDFPSDGKHKGNYMLMDESTTANGREFRDQKYNPNSPDYNGGPTADRLSPDGVKMGKPVSDKKVDTALDTLQGKKEPKAKVEKKHVADIVSDHPKGLKGIIQGFRHEGGYGRNNEKGPNWYSLGNYDMPRIPESDMDSMKIGSEKRYTLANGKVAVLKRHSINLFESGLVDGKKDPLDPKNSTLTHIKGPESTISKTAVKNNFNKHEDAHMKHVRSGELMKKYHASKEDLLDKYGEYEDRSYVGDGDLIHLPGYATGVMDKTGLKDANMFGGKLNFKLHQKDEVTERNVDYNGRNKWQHIPAWKIPYIKELK